MVRDTVQDTHDHNREQFSFDHKDVDKVFQHPRNLQTGDKSFDSDECHIEVADHKLDHSLCCLTSRADFSTLTCRTCMIFAPSMDILDKKCHPYDIGVELEDDHISLVCHIDIGKPGVVFHTVVADEEPFSHNDM